MAKCVKCRKDIQDDFVYCPWCGKKQITDVPTKSRRANGTGTVKRNKSGRSWIAIGGAVPVICDGKIVYKRPEKWGFRTKAEALAYAQQMSNNFVRKDYSKITFSEIYAKFLEQHSKRVSKSTLDCYKAAYKHYAVLHPAPFTALITEDWQACMDDCVQGRRTKENMKALGTLMYNYAASQDITHKNFAQYLYVGDDQQVSRNAFTRSEEELILQKALEGMPWADYIACGIYLGFRPTALFNIRKSDYDPVEHTISGGIKTKAGRDRVVTISPKIQPLIDRLLRTPGDYLFPNPDGKQFTADNFRKDYFYKTLAGLCIQPIPGPNETPKYTPYSWRHTFFTKMARASGAEKFKAELGGHTSYEMSKKYQHSDLDDKRFITDQF